jgi:hypothetical protein
MTQIYYQIGSHTGNQTNANTFSEATTVREQIMQQEIQQLNWWPIICWVENNDGTITACPMDASGNPVTIDESGNTVPYVDTTTKTP